MAMLGSTHKEAYKHIFWTTLAIPLVLVIVAAAIATAVWPVA
jgi:hypothetical protein